MPASAATARAATIACGVVAASGVGAALAAAVAAAGGGAATPGEQFSASYRHPAIEYATGPRTDRVAEFHARLRLGDRLPFDRRQGFLPAVLDALDVPVESQTLVFSKTSLQADAINPGNPRAIYFTDDVAVAWIRGSPAIELAALDPRQGVMFYALVQREPARGFERPRSCLECHVSAATLGVPGLAVGSAVVDPGGAPYSSIPVDQRTPIESRWGGWYVTGSTGLGRHVGNTVATDPDRPMLLHDDANFNLPSVAGRFDTSGYPTPYSDIAALMVLEHQTHMTNLLVRTGWEFRVAAHEQRATRGLFAAPGGRSGDPALRGAVRDLVDYMLFVDEAPLTDRMVGTSGFAEVFEARGPFDGRGRTLREIALDRRLFRYSCSYLIYSAAFDALPSEARAAVYRRLWQVLSGSDRDPRYARLSRRDRQDIVDILRATKPQVAPYFGGNVR
ncbi:MAG: hypothetical protein OXH75_14580 [Acidobacteria bacterium]|nr:hypothetical protein [Acidobacteriota bacterium]